MTTDPVETDSDLYRVVLENDRVRVLEYLDAPGDHTSPHRHPDSVMVTLSAFRRRISAGGTSIEVDLPAGTARWVGAQEHAGHNIGETPTHSIFVELKEPRTGPSESSEPTLGPSRSTAQ
ncbi:Uncharacterised protein [Amycolatopsis camponoti]|uniref:Cytoplasmic protein n=1 Tax=Amycolatopsis camponoti TaxID=2606593 RepID=A0A6I8M3H2_9PSEU|nr:cytoplasmic protein [Amycolatopsis camponoti]VVJ22089.1 Uncharacterised protein [Amycolatopsis camponoti]